MSNNALPALDNHSLKLSLMQTKLKDLRSLALTADRDARVGLKFCEMAAPFFREYGKDLSAIVKDTAEIYEAVKEANDVPKN